MEITCGADEVNGRAQLLVTQPALMLFSALKPGPGYHTASSNQGTDQHAQQVRHGSQGSYESVPHGGVRPPTGCLEVCFTQRVNQPMPRSEVVCGARGTRVATGTSARA